MISPAGETAMRGMELSISVSERPFFVWKKGAMGTVSLRVSSSSYGSTRASVGMPVMRVASFQKCSALSLGRNDRFTLVHPRRTSSRCPV